jgi:hypothetical protein
MNHEIKGLIATSFRLSLLASESGFNMTNAFLVQVWKPVGHAVIDRDDVGGVSSFH